MSENIIYDSRQTNNIIKKAKNAQKKNKKEVRRTDHDPQEAAEKGFEEEEKQAQGDSTPKSIEKSQEQLVETPQKTPGKSSQVKQVFPMFQKKQSQSQDQNQGRENGLVSQSQQPQD